MDEIPKLSYEELAELIASLREAEARIKAGWVSNMIRKHSKIDSSAIAAVPSGKNPPGTMDILWSSGHWGTAASGNRSRVSRRCGPCAPSRRKNFRRRCRRRLREFLDRLQAHPPR